MTVKETISKIVDYWFMYEPLLFNTYCTHKLVENTKMGCPMRTGNRCIEYNPEILKDWEPKQISEALKIEVTRILLKHPYERVPDNPNRCALKNASDVTISEHCFSSSELIDARYYNLESQLSYEEYYRKLYYICDDKEQTSSSGKGQGDVNEETQSPYAKAAESAALWSEDEEMCDTVNQQIIKAQKNNQWGSISGSFMEEVNASLFIPMDYRRMLSQFRASIISQRRVLTRMKPNRRYDFDYMGSKYEPKTKLLVAVDVSGSVGSDDLKRFYSIINRFFSYGVEHIQVITFDTEIKSECSLKKASRKIKITGRGGTDFQPAIDFYEAHPEYQGLIIFTDGYAATPVIKKRKQILWVLTSKDEFDYSNEWIKKLPDNKATWIPLEGK